MATRSREVREGLDGRVPRAQSSGCLLLHCLLGGTAGSGCPAALLLPCLGLISVMRKEGHFLP